ncbi:MerR family transcriptional regulator [Streptosporangium carneum]|uniref:MerR family transcriptional regulator n=1 Tax=Streptosporangium carneum TaxID=47481 RepID=UPI0022F2A6CA|nr:MerR family transcriptional regulator [Streptosporangium carneum]
MKDDLLPIGQFARLCRLSVKQLRHYADLGLLPPAWVDPASGYRYYRADQARQALSIGLLRSLDVPLSAIGEVLSGTTAVQALERIRDELEAELARRRRTLATLERLLSQGLPSARVRLARERPQRVVTTRETAASPQDIGRATTACVARLLEHAHAPRAGGGQDEGPRTADVRLVGLFPVEMDEPIPVTVALRTDGPAPRGTRQDVLPGGLFARATHIGPYDQINLTAHALLAWCAERGHAPHGPIREVYLSDPARTPPERLATRLMVRLGEAAP